MSRAGKIGAAALIASGALSLFSPQLQDFLGRWEGEGQNVVYADRLARGLPTVCKGITKHTSPYPVVVGDYWSPEKCAEVERLVVERGQLSLADCITAEVSQGTFDALSSHAHNFGVPATCASRALGLINTVNNIAPVSGNVTITANDITGISEAGKTGSYNDLTDKPTIPGPYTLPPATTSTLGGVRPDGTSITVDANGVISASGGGGGSSGMIASGFLQSPYNLTPPPAFIRRS